METHRTYYTVNDLWDTYPGNVWDDISDAVDNLAQIISAININIPSDEMLAATSDAYSKKMFADFMRRCYDEEIAFADDVFDNGELISSENVKAEYNSWCLRAAAYIKRTLPQHKTILDAYAAKASTILSAVHSTNSTTTKNNDMPVSATDLANHLSGLDEIISSADDDGGTAIARLNELQRLYDDELVKWENEFASKFSFEALE